MKQVQNVTSILCIMLVVTNLIKYQIKILQSLLTDKKNKPQSNSYSDEEEVAFLKGLINSDLLNSIHYFADNAGYQYKCKTIMCRVKKIEQLQCDIISDEIGTRNNCTMNSDYSNDDYVTLIEDINCQDIKNIYYSDNGLPIISKNVYIYRKNNSLDSIRNEYYMISYDIIILSYNIICGYHNYVNSLSSIIEDMNLDESDLTLRNYIKV